MTMSTSFATPDSGHSDPRTPSRGQPPSEKEKVAKSSLVDKVSKYYVPENREQYQKFGYDESFMLDDLRDKKEFLEFLGFDPESVLNPSEPVPDLLPRGMGCFLDLANSLAKFIQSEHYLFLYLAFLLTYNFTLESRKGPALEFRDTGSKSPPGHVTDTRCRPDIMAAFRGHWKDGVVSWPLIRLAGEVASKGTAQPKQSEQAKSYLHYLLLARPDLDIAQGLLTDENKITFLFGIGGEGIRQFDVEWENPDLNRLLYAFIYRLYEPGDFADSSYITEVDENITPTYTIKINYPGGPTEPIKCDGFYSIYARNPFATRTHVLSNPGFTLEGKVLTILKDQICRGRRFEELEILNNRVHNPEQVPGVVVAAYGQNIKPPRSKERSKHRLGLGESGSPFMSIPTLSDMLETSFDVLEGI